MARLTVVRSSVLSLGVLAAACGERSAPLSPLGAPVTPAAASPSAPRQMLECRANVLARSITCGGGTLGGGASLDVIVGGQNVFVALAASNPTYVGTTFSTDVTLQNLITQALGTTDGTTADGTGARVFFVQEPVVTDGSGVVTLMNIDGSTTFTAANQPYFQFEGATMGGNAILSQNEISTAKSWQFDVPATVVSFAFKVYVSANVHFPDGYIDVTPAALFMITAGDSLSLVGVVRNFTGVASGDQSIVWGSTNPPAATVAASGMVNAVAVGHGDLVASQGPRSASVPAIVCPNLAVGETFTFPSAESAAFCLSGFASPAEYTMTPLNLATSGTVSTSVLGSGIQAVTGPPSPTRLPTGGAMLTQLFDDNQLAAQAQEEDARHARELATQPSLQQLRATRAAYESDPSNRLRRTAARTSRTLTPGGVSRIITPNVVPAVGDLMDINTNSACSGSPSIRTGRVASVSQHLIILSDTLNPAGGFSNAVYDSIGFEFDTLAWPVDSGAFGMPTDLDNNSHVVAFFTRAVNELSPPASSSVVLGFWASKDVFGTDDCSNSNGQATVGGEIFYMLVPDPTGAVNSNVRTVLSVRGSTTGTLGHEFQHMINGFRRAYVTGASFFETGFMNEGLSHIAEELMFARSSGMPSGSNVSPGTNATSGVQLNSRRVAAYNAYMSQNIGRLRPWLQRPDTTGAFKNNANSLAVRGAIWAFLRYASDRVTTSDDNAFFQTLVNSNLEGIPNIQNAIGGDVPTTWLRDFTMAFYADDAVAGISPIYTHPSWNYRGMYALLFGSYSLLARPLTNNTPLTLSYSSGGGTAFTRFGVPAAGHAKLSVLSGGVIITSPYAITVMRTK